MSMKRMKHKGLILATVLLAGCVLAAFAAASNCKAACTACKKDAACASCKTKVAKDSHLKLAGELELALSDLSTAEKAIQADKKPEALAAIAKVKASLTKIHGRVKPPVVEAVKGWTDDVDKAMKYAAASKRQILMDFSGSDWCGWCIKLHNEVFVKDAFKAYADKNLVLVEVDFPRGKEQSAEMKARNSKLATKYGVRGFPTVIVLDPTTGKELGRTGYVKGGPEAFITAVKKITGK